MCLSQPTDMTETIPEMIKSISMLKPETKMALNRTSTPKREVKLAAPIETPRWWPEVCGRKRTRARKEVEILAYT
jgi:hypothetical protein